MAIAEMRKLHLVAMSYDKDAILNALQKTGAAEIKLQLHRQGTEAVAVDTEELSVRLTSVEAALSTLIAEVETYEKEHKLHASPQKDGFLVTYSQFMDAKNHRAEVEASVKRIAELADEKNAYKAELSKAKRETSVARVYAPLDCSFASFADTDCTQVRFGTVQKSVWEACAAALNEQSLCAYQPLFEADGFVVFFVVTHRSAEIEVGGVLASFGFTDCPYKAEETGAELQKRCEEKERELEECIAQTEEALYALKTEIRPLKIYADYLAF